MSRRPRATTWAAGLVLAVCTGLVAVAQGRATRQDAPPPRGDAALRREGDEGGRRWGGPGRRELSEQDVQRIIATARDIDPAWGDALEQARGRDASELRQRLGMQGRRLIGLSWLRERQPELYQSRVEDFRTQREAKRAVEAIRRAKESGDAVAEAQALAEAREAIVRQVELDIKARAHELVAMDKALKDAKQRLQADIEARDQRVQAMLEAAGRGEMPHFGREGVGPGMGVEWGEPGGPEGPRSPRPRGDAGGKPKP
jgi:hypothetical protein